jgi:hypothetical protein
VALSVRFYSASHCRFSVGCLLVSKGLYQVLSFAFLLLSFAISLSWIHSVCMWGFGGALLVVVLRFFPFFVQLGVQFFFLSLFFWFPSSLWFSIRLLGWFLQICGVLLVASVVLLGAGKVVLGVQFFFLFLFLIVGLLFCRRGLVGASSCCYWILVSWWAAFF